MVNYLEIECSEVGLLEIECSEAECFETLTVDEEYEGFVRRSKEASIARKTGIARGSFQCGHVEPIAVRQLSTRWLHMQGELASNFGRARRW
jgi:hypothetical protein